ncbi:MAG: GYD domain-containing protein [Candidatus Zixiibacteriota bacterium]
MRTFVMMTKIAPQDANIIEVSNKLKAHTKSNIARIEGIKKQCPEINFLAHYALLGPYDYMDIYEAPDETVAARVSLLSRGYGAFQIESWIAIPSKEIAEMTEGICSEESNSV